MLKDNKKCQPLLQRKLNNIELATLKAIMPIYEKKLHNLQDTNLRAAETQSFCPPGWTITKDTMRHHRWLAISKTKCITVSKSWGVRTGFSDGEACTFVVSTIWKKVHN